MSVKHVKKITAYRVLGEINQISLVIMLSFISCLVLGKYLILLSHLVIFEVRSTIVLYVNIIYWNELNEIFCGQINISLLL
jgi:hypothetical protein